MKQLITAALLLLSLNVFGQQILVDSLRRTQDTLGNVFYQRYTEIDYGNGGMQTNLTPPVDSASFVDSLLVGTYNRYLPATYAKKVSLNQPSFDRDRNTTNSLLAPIGLSYWDFTDQRFANQFTGLWRVIDVVANTNTFHEARIVNGRLVFRQVDASFSRDSLKNRVWSGAFSPGSSNKRALIQNADELRFNNFHTEPIEVVFYREVANDDGVGTSRLIFVDTTKRFRFIFLRDISKG